MTWCSPAPCTGDEDLRPLASPARVNQGSKATIPAVLGVIRGKQERGREVGDGVRLVKGDCQLDVVAPSLVDRETGGAKLNRSGNGALNGTIDREDQFFIHCPRSKDKPVVVTTHLELQINDVSSKSSLMNEQPPGIRFGNP